ncbi:MAG TPA: YggT family protein [Treponemataceae bacterium]|nr:YggT family protein [Treponemataceae bacterium]HPM05376.1 YggT family protein [Treponemataceae bacterium]
MDLFFGLLRLLSFAISIYSFLCLIRLLLSFSPSLQQNSFYAFLTSICDPYLYLFRKLTFLRLNQLDFSPIISLGLLYMLTQMLNTIIAIKRFSLGILLSVIVNFAFSIVNSFLFFLIIILAIRLIFLLLNKDTSSIWFSFDQFIKPIADFITKKFYKNSFYTFQKSLIISLISFIVFSAIFKIVAFILVSFFQTLPF